MTQYLHMIVLALRSNDSKLRNAFERYNERFVAAASQGLPFLRKVELLREAETAKREIEAVITRLNASGTTEVKRLPEQWFSGFGDSKDKYAFMNGLYEPDRLRGMLRSNKDLLSAELNDSCHSLLHDIKPDEYVLFWNVGELEADGILQN